MKYTQPSLKKLNKKYNTDVKKPVIKNVYRKTIKAVKKGVKLALITTLLFSKVYNVAREIKEEITTENNIVDMNFGVGSFVIKNKDERSATQIYDAMIKAGLEVEGLTDMRENFDSKTTLERKEFVNKFVNAVAEPAGIRLNDVVYLDDLIKNSTVGMYAGINVGGVTLTTNTIFLKKELLQQDFDTLIETAFHEVVHAVENINIETNSSINNYEEDVYKHYFKYSSKVYKSLVPEIVANLTAAKFMGEVEKINANEEDKAFIEYASTRRNLSEILEEIIKIDKNLTGNTDNYYNKLSIKEIINISLYNQYTEKNKVFDEEKLESSYIYEVLNYTLGKDKLEVNYYDYKNYYDNVESWDLNEEYNKLKDYTAYFKEENYASMLSNYDAFHPGNTSTKKLAEEVLAQTMLKILGSIKYDSENYDKALMKNSYGYILDNVNLLSDEVKKEFNLNSLSAITQTTNNYEDDLTM